MRPILSIWLIAIVLLLASQGCARTRVSTYPVAPGVFRITTNGKSTDRKFWNVITNRANKLCGGRNYSTFIEARLEGRFLQTRITCD